MDADDTTAHAQAGVSAKVAALSIFALWLCYFFITTLRAWIVGLDFDTSMLVPRSLVCLAGITITFLMWMIFRLTDKRPLWVKALFAASLSIPAALAIAQVNQTAFAETQKEVIERMGEQQGVKLRQDDSGNILLQVPQEVLSSTASSGEITVARAPVGIDRWRQLSGAALSPYFVLLTWAALYLAILAGEQARHAERRGERFRGAARAAELRSLRYQVNPHFLFNALNSLSALVMTGKGDRAEEMIQGLARFYRHSLAEDPTGDVELADEFALQREYLAIESVRFPDRLRLDIDLPAALEQVRIPGMILQPLVENSVKYGVAPVTRPVTITLSARAEFGRLVLTVADDGPGAKTGSSAGAPGFGIGLANVRDRIEARFGPGAAIESGPVPGGYRTELRLPIETRES